MRRAACTLLVLLSFAWLPSGCATPDYRVPALDEALTLAEQDRLAERALALSMERRASVYDLAWPILTANAELCEDAKPQAGIVLADRKLLARMAGGMEEAALERLGVPGGLRVVHVMAGGPAAAAGVPVGGTVEAVGGEAVSEADDAVRLIAAALEEGEASVTVDGTPYAFGGEAACAAKVKVSANQSLNADAVDGITIYTGLIRSLSDEALSAVIAHELAHVALGHKAKYVRNAAVTGAAVAGPFLYPLARTADRALGLVGAEPERSLTARTLRALAPWAETFEAEADHVGLYMLARAGGDPEAATEVFELFGTESPRSLTVRATHPLAPERLARLRATILEIEAKRAAGQALLPEAAD
jgi:hypothetical protein